VAVGFVTALKVATVVYGLWPLGRRLAHVCAGGCAGRGQKEGRSLTDASDTLQVELLGEDTRAGSELDIVDS
jgi:hypothetical protein